MVWSSGARIDAVSDGSFDGAATDSCGPHSLQAASVIARTAASPFIHRRSIVPSASVRNRQPVARKAIVRRTDAGRSLARLRTQPAFRPRSGQFSGLPVGTLTDCSARLTTGGQPLLRLATRRGTLASIPFAARNRAQTPVRGLPDTCATLCLEEGQS